MKYISVFSGIEAATVAFDSLGWTPLAFSEIDPFCCAVLSYRFPDVPNLGDITKIDWRKYRGKCDLIVGGSPCQSFSVAGKREGLNGESALMFEYVRSIREVRPKWCIWENVPGALTVEHGQAFLQLLSELEKRGYCLAWRVLDAQYFGIPQRRRRIYVVGSLRNTGAVDVLFEPEMLRGDIETGEETRETATRNARGGADLDRGKEPNIIALQVANTTANGCGYNDSGVSYTLDHTQANAVVLICVGDDNGRATITENVAGTLKVGGSPSIVSDGCVVRRLMPIECERLQGFPDDWTSVPYRGKQAADTPRYKALGNSFAVPVIKWIAERIERVEREKVV